MRAPRVAPLLLASMACAATIAAASGAGAEPDKGPVEAPAMGAELLDQDRALDQAILKAEQQLTSRQRALGPDHSELATALRELAALHIRKRRQDAYERAEPLLRRAVQIREKDFDPDHPKVAEVVYELAVLQRKMRIFERAEPNFLRALHMREKTFGPDSLPVAEVENDLGLLYRRVRLDDRAEKSFLRAIRIREKELGPDSPLVAETDNHLAMVYYGRGQIDKSEKLLVRALAIYESKLGPGHPSVASVLKNLAVIYRDRGEYEEAEERFQRAIAILENAERASEPEIANPLYNLAKLYRKQKRSNLSEPLLLRALAVSERAYGLDHPDVAYSQNELGVLCSMRGDYAHAEPLLTRAISIFEKELGPEHPDVADALNDLSLMYLWKGEVGRAEPLLHRVLKIQERALGKNHLDIANTMSVMAGFYLLRGNIEEAARARARGSRIRDKQAAAVLATGSEKRKRAYMATLQKDTDATVSLHAFSAPKSADAAKVALTTILRRKGRVLDAMTDSLMTLRSHMTKDAQSLLDKLSGVVSELSTLASRAGGDLSAEARLARIQALDDEQERLEEEISKRSAEFRADRRLVTVKQVQALIPEQTALIEVLLYRPFDARASSIESHWGAPRYVAYRLGHTGDAAAVDLGEARLIDAQVDELREALSDPGRDPTKAARALDEAVMRPVRGLLGDAHHVFLSPDSELNLVPFSALIDEEGRYLIERYEFTYLTSGRDLIRFEAKAPPRDGPVLIANPDFGAIPIAIAGRDRGHRELDFNDISFPPLPGTAAEAKALEQRIAGARVLTGGSATEAELKALHAPRIVHIATHGFFLPSFSDEGSGAPLSGRGVEDSGGSTLAYNPLLRAGLALAGANLHETGKDDGVLTALEAAALDLYGTKLIVLSACETGIGQVQSGDGVYGLRRALVMAGSETQVMSLWKVDDDATRQLMDAYYARLNAGEGRSAAMREVGLLMRKQPRTAHPYFWASFIVSGADSPLERRAPVPPPIKPGPKGGHCACAEAGEQGGGGGPAGVFVFGLGALALARGRRRR